MKEKSYILHCYDNLVAMATANNLIARPTHCLIYGSTNCLCDKILLNFENFRCHNNVNLKS